MPNQKNTKNLKNQNIEELSETYMGIPGKNGMITKEQLKKFTKEELINMIMNLLEKINDNLDNVSKEQLQQFRNQFDYMYSKNKLHELSGITNSAYTKKALIEHIIRNQLNVNKINNNPPQLTRQPKVRNNKIH